MQAFKYSYLSHYLIVSLGCIGSDGGETCMDLVANSALGHVDLESSLVTPSVVPGVDSEPVVNATFVSPADELDGMTTEGRSGFVLVDTALVGKEIFIDGEGGSDGSVFVDVVLDVVMTADSIGGGGVVLVAGIVDR